METECIPFARPNQFIVPYASAKGMETAKSDSESPPRGGAALQLVAKVL